MKKLLPFLLCTIFLSACANQGQQVKLEGTAVGAGIGAALGAGLGYAFGGGQGAAIGAGIGGLLGGAAGYSYADNIDKEHQALVGKENDIDAQIKVASNMNAALLQNNQHLQSQLAAYNQDVDELQQQAGSQVGTRQKLVAKKHEIDKEYANAEKGLSSAKATLNRLVAMRNGNTRESAELDAQIAQLNTTYKQMQQKSTALASLSQRI
ncbi:MAG: hypothetical protein HOP34_04245 [Methylococcaceae bacterium]|nr:hypothetical protein [Methylococcaceae bacterium]